jgi:Polyketide cyclase / dehydrase and lipid transport
MMSRLKELKEHRGVTLTAVKSEIAIDATAGEIWDALTRFGDVSSFHAGVDLSTAGDDFGDEAALGSERTCVVKDGRRVITLHERITEYEEGECYRYEVFDWKNFPLQVMFFGFEIEEKTDGGRSLSLVQNYRLKPGVLTGLMKWKIRQQQRTILLGYKHYVETGENNVPIKDIEKLVAA